MTLPDRPFVSVIMPVRNEAAFIERSLGAVLAQDYPSDRCEIIIADGMSDDDTRAIIQRLPGSERIRILDNPRRLQAPGLNLALAAARGDVIIRVDGHTIIAPDYVTQCVGALHETGAANVGGAMDPVGITPMGQAIAAAGKSPFAVPTAFHVSQRAQPTDTVYMGAWQRSIFDQVGGFDERFAINEDYELNFRIRQAGGTIYFSPDIRSQYYGRQTLRALAKQYFRYGQWKVQTLRKHPASVRPRQVVAPLFVAALIGGAALSFVSRVFLILFVMGICLYQFLNSAAAYKTTRRAGGASWWRVMLVFWTIHLAWGSGFWVGLTREIGAHRQSLP
ncbi:MAG: glycosyltransferase family 2 protein [Anaerolinea sp.]|nr:glycosyltransferase family 2 protein [Anaerolinea sp.]